jgi:uncharacterized protein YceH (UPF0502 family)
VETCCRKRDLSTTSLMRCARHLLSAEDLRKRAEHLRNLPQKAAQRQQKKKLLKRQKEASAQSLRRAQGRRSDCSSGVLGDVEAMTSAEWGMPSMPQRWSLTAFAAHLTRSPGTLRQRNGLAIPASLECPGAINKRRC